MRLRCTRLSLESWPRRTSLPLDLLSAAAAYSLRLLRTEYVGPLVRVRRSSDNAEQDVGFKIYPPELEPRLNVEDLLAFVGGENYILQSETYSSATWTKTSCNVSGTTLTSTTGGANATGISQVVTVPVGDTAFSVDIMTEGTTSPWVRLASTVGGVTLQSWGNIVTGEAGSSDAGSTITSTAIPGGWRFTMTRTVAATSMTVFVRFASANGVTTAPATGATLVIANTRINTGTVARPYFATTTTASANSGFVPIWYEQSGNERHATQTTAASQPIIVNAGVIESINGRPAIRSNGSSHMMTVSGWTLAGLSQLFANVVALRSGTSASSWPSFLFGTGNVTTAGSQPNQLYVAGRASTSLDASAQAYAALTAFGPTAVAGAGIVGVRVTAANTGIATLNGIDGTETATGFIGSPGTFNNQPYDIFGAGQGQRGWVGLVSEHVVFASDIPLANRQSLERNQGAYYNITVA